MRLVPQVLLTAVWAAPAQSQDSCAFLHQQTQAFSDAGQRGDGEAMARVLDPEVIFFNETGERASRADMAGAKPTPGAAVRAIATTDWNCKVHGDVAVTSFIDVLEPGSPSELKFRSVETWKKNGAVWKMIGSETLTLAQDPDVVALSSDVLKEYAGSYESGTGMKFSFALKGEELVASVNGNDGAVQKAQARDIFFTAGHGATPKVFQRGDDGRITGFIYLRGKSSIVFKRVG